MWSSRLFWKVYLAYALFIALAVILCASVFLRRQEAQLLDSVEHRLHDSAHLLRADLSPQEFRDTRESLQRKLQSLAQSTGTRFTLVAPDGAVMADSSQDSLEAVAAMENHLNRQEFRLALRENEGISQRTSATLGSDFLYYALAHEENGELVGFIRAAQPLAVVEGQLDAMRALIWWIALLAAIVGLGITYWLTRRIVRPIQQLTEAANDLAVGNHPPRVNIASRDELGRLARSFENMSHNLATRERQLREIAELQDTVLSGMLEGVLAVDDALHVQFANMAAGRIFGFDPAQIGGRPLLEIIRNNDLREIANNALRTGKLCQGEIQWQTRQQLSLEVQASPLPGDPCPGAVIVLHDITELKRLEGLRQQFVANVSHELKTPLSSIKAYTETLLSGALEDDKNCRRFLNRIEDQADRLNELIIDMLSLTRIESGQAAIEPTDIPLAKVVAACLADHETIAQSQQIHLINEAGETPIHVEADEEALAQVLRNLVDNAVKYTPAEGTVTLRTREEDSQAVIEVIDTGPGIAPEHHARLFERFYRVDKARSREVGGTGLGLAIVKHLCQAMKGSIEVESSLGHGCTFRVRLPLANEAAS